MGFFWRKKEPLPMYLIFILKIRTANSVPKRFPMKTTIGDAAHGIVPQLSSFISLEFGFHLPLHYIYIYTHNFCLWKNMESLLFWSYNLKMATPADY